MLTPFGKALRVLRLNSGELLKDMAQNLGVTPSYLSAVENGKKEPTQEIMDRLHNSYALGEKEWEMLEEAKVKTIKQLQINFQKEEDEELGLLFARKLSTLSYSQRDRIRDILNPQSRRGEKWGS